MSKTNSLGSHHGERNTYPAHKMIPIAVARMFRGKGSFFKRFHIKKSRAFLKKINLEEQ